MQLSYASIRPYLSARHDAPIKNTVKKIPIREGKAEKSLFEQDVTQGADTDGTGALPSTITLR